MPEIAERLAERLAVDTGVLARETAQVGYLKVQTLWPAFLK